MIWKSFHRYCEIYYLNCSWHQHKQIEPPLTFSTYFCASNRSLNLFLDRSICSLTQFFSFLLALYNNVWCLNVVNFTMIAYFLSFLCPTRCALLIFESGMSTSASFTNLLTFSRTFPTCHPFHMECWLFVDRSFDCIVHCIRANVQDFYIFPEVPHYSLSVFTCFWSKLTVKESFSISFSSSLIICFISTLKTSRKLELIYSIKASLNSSTFSSTAALNSSVLRVFRILK